MNENDMKIETRALIIGAAVIALVVALLVVGAVWLFSPSEGGKEETTPSETTDEIISDEKDEFDTTVTGDAGEDPENREPIGGEGAVVEAEKIKTESGLSKGIDVSRWQGKIDWKAVKASGMDFAYVRIGYRGENGSIYKDDNADYNIQKADEAGLLIGVYFYTNAKTAAEAEEEARWTLEAIAGYPVSYPVVLDCEGFNDPQSRMYLVSREERTENARAFLSLVTKGGYEAMLYGARDELVSSASWNISEIEKDYKIWVAQYPAVTYPAIQKPDYSGRCDAWQYTNKGRVSGIEGGVDMVVCYFERDRKEAKNESKRPANAAPPLTDEEKIYTLVNETVTAKNMTNLRTAATTKSDVVATLYNGETVTRVAVGTNGWSKLSYNGKTVYAISSYLTTDLSLKTEDPADQDIVDGQTFSKRADRVTAKEVVNLRALPNTSSEILGTLRRGEFLDRTAVGDRGWSRLTYNGKDVYAVTSYITTDMPSEDTTLAPETGKPETAPPDTTGEGFKTQFSAVDERVTAKVQTNLRDAPSTVTGNVVYTLKNGEFVKRTGVSQNGWSRLEYNGMTLYAVTSYLTTDAPIAETTSSETAPSETTATDSE